MNKEPGPTSAQELAKPTEAVTSVTQATAPTEPVRTTSVFQTQSAQEDVLMANVSPTTLALVNKEQEPISVQELAKLITLATFVMPPTALTEPVRTMSVLRTQSAQEDAHTDSVSLTTPVLVNKELVPINVQDSAKELLVTSVTMESEATVTPQSPDASMDNASNGQTAPQPVLMDHVSKVNVLVKKEPE